MPYVVEDMSNTSTATLNYAEYFHYYETPETQKSQQMQALKHFGCSFCCFNHKHDALTWIWISHSLNCLAVQGYSRISPGHKSYHISSRNFPRNRCPILFCPFSNDFYWSILLLLTSIFQLNSQNAAPRRPKLHGDHPDLPSRRHHLRVCTKSWP